MTGMDAEVMSAEGTGNTKAVPSAGNTKRNSKNARKDCFGPSRGFAWTLFNFEEEWDALYKYFKSKRAMRYLICGKEVCPKTGREHYQGYVYYSRDVYFPKSKIGTLHIEPARYNADINERYCKKGKNIIVEEGEKPHPGKRMGAKEIIELKPNEIIENDPYNAKRLLEVKEMLTPLNALNWTKNIKVYYLWGNSGIGKSNWVQNKLFELDIDNIDTIDFSNGFWQGITGLNEVAVYDEFRHETMQPKDFIKLIDYRRQRLNIKGGSKLNNYTMIFITSTENPEYFMQWHYEDKKQWMRRMEVIHLTEPVKLNRNLAKILGLDLEQDWIEQDSREMGISS